MTGEIKIELTTDRDYIQSVFLHPSIYASMCDDSCPVNPGEVEVGRALAVPGFFLCAMIGDWPVGAFWLVNKDDAVEAHTALLPECRGRDAIRVTRAAIRWVFDHTGVSAITSYAWSDSPQVAWFCRAVGMSKTRTDKWPNTRSGRPVDITYFTIRREES